jgi:hypothetical protein
MGHFWEVVFGERKRKDNLPKNKRKNLEREINIYVAYRYCH